MEVDVIGLNGSSNICNSKPQVVSNGNKVLHRQSSYSMLNHDSNGELTTSIIAVKPTFDSSPSNKSLKYKPIAAGDILLGGFVPQTPSRSPSCKSNNRSSYNSDHSNISHQTNTSRRGGDEPDSIPTRTGKKKTLFDEKVVHMETPTTPVDQCADSTASVKDQDNDSQNNFTPKKPYKRATCCSVFCALFKCKYLLTRYTIIDLGLNIGSIGLYIFDFVTDLLNAFAYLDRREENRDNIFYFALTMFFIFVPSIVMHAFSVWWEVEDQQHIKQEKKKRNLKTSLGCCYFISVVFSHIFQLGPVYRYLRTIYFGLKSRYYEVKKNEKRWKFFDDKYKGELSDVNFIRLMESFLEAAPQLVLQIFIMIRTKKIYLITALSVSVSLFGMAISFVAYQRALRSTLDDKEQLTVTGSIVLFLYRTFTIVSRVFALALLLNVNVWAWIGLFVIHWIIMAVCIALKKTSFCPTKAREYFYDAVIGFCYNFAYINVHFDSHNRYRMTIYYIVMFVENLTLAICWFYFRQGGGSIIDALTGQTPLIPPEEIAENALSNELALALVMVVIATFFLGIMFLVIYYIGLHPKTAGIRCCLDQDSIENRAENRDDDQPPEQVVKIIRCGDNYRINRGSTQFRSWHSASLHCDPAETDDLVNRDKRPSSEILGSSGAGLYDQPRPSNELNSDLDINSITCSCYSLRNNLTDYRHVGRYERVGSSQATRSTQPRPSTSDYHKVLLASPHRSYTVDSLNEAELKRQQVTKLIEAKQKVKKELEHKQALLQLDLLRRQNASSFSTKNRQDLVDIHDEEQGIFNRKQKARHLYARHDPTSAYNQPLRQELRDLSYISTRSGNQFGINEQHSTLPLRHPPSALDHHTQVQSRKHLNHPDEKKASHRTSQLSHVIGSGTFPRCSRPNYGHKQPHQPGLGYRQPSSLKPISENKQTFSPTQGTSSSLMNLSATQRSSANASKVPRVLSFTISKNEVVESIESSL